jgi:probable aminopeptidase NPEPL1
MALALRHCASVRSTRLRPALLQRACRRAATTTTTTMAAAKPAAELHLVSGAPPADADALVFVGSKARLMSPAVTALVPTSAGSVWEGMVSSCASGDAGGSATTWLPPAADGGKARKLTVAVLPAACSRHNCAAQPHALASLVSGALGNGGATSVALAVPPSHALASVAALARSLPLYSAKSAKAGAPEAEAQPPARCTAGLLALPEDESDASGAAFPLHALLAAADAVRLAGRLVDTPPEEMSTDHFRAEARAVADSLGARVAYTEIVGPALRDAGFGGIWGVGKAAAAPPALVVLSFTPPPEAADASLAPVALVGKGIIYDTGGLSLKVGGGMVGMKCDCGGAAAMLAAFSAAVASGSLTRPLHCVLCLAENAIGPGAFRNDDILRMYSGKSVEINNTDAEGRLVLADGVAYACKHLSPGTIIDMATLTGAQLVATGKRHAAVVANTEALEAAAVAAGRASGDLVHPLPFCPEFFRSEFASKVADMRNSVKDRSNAQSSCAANFVFEHLAADYTGGWLHVDIAGPAWIGDRGTGYGVALLLELLRAKSV